jgi:hypothetical protein
MQTTALMCCRLIYTTLITPLLLLVSQYRFRLLLLILLQMRVCTSLVRTLIRRLGLLNFQLGLAMAVDFDAERNLFLVLVVHWGTETTRMLRLSLLLSIIIILLQCRCLLVFTMRFTSTGAKMEGNSVLFNIDFCLLSMNRLLEMDIWL